MLDEHEARVKLLQEAITERLQSGEAQALDAQTFMARIRAKHEVKQGPLSEEHG